MIITVRSKATNTYIVSDEINITKDFNKAIKKPIMERLSNFNLRTNIQRISFDKKTFAITIEKGIIEKTGETLEQYLITQRKLYSEL